MFYAGRICSLMLEYRENPFKSCQRNVNWWWKGQITVTRPPPSDNLMRIWTSRSLAERRGLWATALSWNSWGMTLWQGALPTSNHNPCWNIWDFTVESHPSEEPIWFIICEKREDNTINVYAYELKYQFRNLGDGYFFLLIGISN